jgi:pimeloyl-ACP methyl ester carboxylesterase
MSVRIGIGLSVWVLILALAGCGSSPPSLTAEELAKKYPDEKFVQVGGVSLHYEQVGLGRPVVLMHGLLTYSYTWRHIIPGLTYGSTLYNLDLMGLGLSEKPQDRTYDINTYVSQLATFIEDFHLHQPILVGQDVSALVALLYTLRNPDKVRKLVLINAPLHGPLLPFSLRRLGWPGIGELFSHDWFLKRVLRGGVLDPADMPEVLLKYYLAPFETDPGARPALRKFVSEFNADSILKEEILPNLGKLQLPVLLLWGGQNAYASLDVGRQLDDEIPNSRLEVVLRTSHYIQEERPEDVRVKLKDFFQKKEQPAS